MPVSYIACILYSWENDCITEKVLFVELSQ